MQTEVTRGVTSDADGVVKRLAAGSDHFAAVVVAAMAADVVGAFQLTAVAAVRMGFMRQSLMAASHTSA